MESIVVGLISLLVGFLMIVFRMTLAKKIIEQQNKFWGFNFGETAINAGQAVVTIIGLSFIILGLMFLFQLISLKEIMVRKPSSKLRGGRLS